MILLVLAPGAFACGRERWPVKVGTDHDAAKVSLSPIPAAIAVLGAITAPAHPDERRASRFAPTEFRVFKVSGVLAVIKTERVAVVLCKPLAADLAGGAQLPDKLVEIGFVGDDRPTVVAPAHQEPICPKFATHLVSARISQIEPSPVHVESTLCLEALREMGGFFEIEPDFPIFLLNQDPGSVIVNDKQNVDIHFVPLCNGGDMKVVSLK